MLPPTHVTYIIMPTHPHRFEVHTQICIYHHFYTKNEREDSLFSHMHEQLGLRTHTHTHTHTHSHSRAHPHTYTLI